MSWATCLGIDSDRKLDYNDAMAIIKRHPHDVRDHASLKHDAIGRVQFAWDGDDFVIVVFTPKNESMPLWASKNYNLFSNQLVTIGKTAARAIWDDLVSQHWEDVE